MQVECYETEKPIAKVCKIEKELVEEASAYMGMKNYAIIAEIGQGIVLPKKKKYSIKIILGGFVLESNPAMFQQNNYNRFNQRFD